MWTLVSIVVVFLLASAGVAALARSTTARWERDRRRAERARRGAAAPPPVPHHGVAVRLGRALATARPAAARVRVLRQAAGTGLTTVRQRGGRAVPHLTAALRHVHLEHSHPTQLAARVVHRRRRRRPAQPADEHSEQGN
jgi:hypothetical protein